MISLFDINIKRNFLMYGITYFAIYYSCIFLSIFDWMIFVFSSGNSWIELKDKPNAIRMLNNIFLLDELSPESVEYSKSLIKMPVWTDNDVRWLLKFKNRWNCLCLKRSENIHTHRNEATLDVRLNYPKPNPISLKWKMMCKYIQFCSYFQLS